jgi:STE24 endopeptidase
MQADAPGGHNHPMLWITAAFIAAVLASTLLSLWLSERQIGAVARHRDRVPEPFADRISAEEHGRAADYTIAKVRFGRFELITDALVALGLTVGGGIAALDALWQRTGLSSLWLGAGVIASVVLVKGLIDLPFSVWRTFRLEQRFGFNRTTPALFAADLLKELALLAVLGGPVLLLTLTLMERAGRWWWLWTWGAVLALLPLLTWAGPAFIAPLFNRFSPLPDEALRARIEALLTRCGFASRGVFVMDGSIRSTHGNAYFTGLGRNKRIVFFDTLLNSLAPPEVEAVLAHELGHFRLRHIRQRLAVVLATSLAGLALLGWLAAEPAFYAALGVPTASTHAALLLFSLAAPYFLFFTTPLAALWSRKHELEADTFAASHAAPADLATALVKLNRDNASTLTPDPVYAAFYYSHPPALTRIARLRAAAAAQ